MKNYNPLDPLFARMLSDEFYMISVLESLLEDKFNNANITAFNRKREYEDDASKEESTQHIITDSCENRLSMCCIMR